LLKKFVGEVRSQESGVRRQETGDRRQETGDRRQETGDRRQETRGSFILPTPHTPHPTPCPQEKLFAANPI
jgi:DNA gyrase subunit A